MKRNLFFVFTALFIVFISLTGCSKDSNPAAAPTATPTVVPTATPVDETVYVEDSLEGFICEGCGAGAGSIQVGDTQWDQNIQGILSYSMPVMGGTVLEAKIYVYLAVTEGSPLTDIGNVHVAHITDSFTDLNALAFTGYASNTSLGVLCDSTDSGWYSLDVTAAVENDRVNGRTYSQFRLYCNGASDADATKDWFLFRDAASGTEKSYMTIKHY